jgi:galactokinase
MDQQQARQLSASFEDRYDSVPLLIFSPGRINIIGEHTDYNLGYVLPAAIDRGIFLALQKCGNKASTWVAWDIGEDFQPQISNDTPGRAKGWKGYFYGILAELKKRGIHPGTFNLMFSGNIPAGAGLSSSAALENAFVFGLNELFELGLSRMDMVQISNAAEQNYMGVQCGIMDQYAGMFGQADQAIFLDCQTLESEKVPLNIQGYSWLLLDTGVKHSLAESAYNERRSTCESIAARFGVSSLRAVSMTMLEEMRSAFPEGDYQKALYVLQENQRVLKAVEAIKTEDLATLGKLMFSSHKGLKEQYEVSCGELDFLVDLARESEGVLGARMMGGGFGGCTLNLVRTELCQHLEVIFQRQFRRHFGRSLSTFTIHLGDGCQLLPDRP